MLHGLCGGGTDGPVGTVAAGAPVPCTAYSQAGSTPTAAEESPCGQQLNDNLQENGPCRVGYVCEAANG